MVDSGTTNSTLAASIAVELAALTPLDAATVQLGPGLLAGGHAFRFALRVRDFLGQESAPVTVSVARQREPAPIISIGAALVLSLPRAGQVALPAEAARQLAGCEGDGGGTVAFTWSVACAGGGGEALCASGGCEAATLLVPGTALPAGRECVLTARGCVASGECGERSVNATVLDAPLVAAIVGGSRSVPSDAPLTLDASASGDPDEPDAQLSAVWSCEPIADAQGSLAACPLTLPTGLLLSVAATDLQPGRFRYSVSVASGAEQASAAVTVAVVLATAATPAVALTSGCPAGGAKLNPTAERVALSAAVALEGSPAELAAADLRDINLLWEVHALDALGGDALGGALNLTGSTSTGVVDRQVAKVKERGLTSNLVLLPAASRVFEPGTAYRFTLTATFEGAEAFASCDALFNAPPRGCKLVASVAGSGAGGAAVELVDEISLSAPTCVDDAEDLPLRYAFAYATSEGTQPLTSTLQLTRTLDGVKLPYADGGAVRVLLSAYDQHGASSIVETEVLVARAVVSAALADAVVAKQTADLERGDTGGVFRSAAVLMTAINREVRR